MNKLLDEIDWSQDVFVSLTVKQVTHDLTHEGALGEIDVDLVAP